jgi:hypothetical protein
MDYHGQSYSREYGIWANMRQRCGNPHAANYMIYGGRGIKVCERWKLFRNFMEDMGPAPSLLHTLDRIDSDGHYEPGNVRWADAETQQNNRRNVVKITAYGQTLTLSQWTRKTGLSRDQIKHRIFVMGMTPEQALESPRMSWQQKQVIQMDMTGNEIARYNSYAEVKKKFGGGSAWNALSGRAKTAYGFKWKYAE